MANTPDGMHDQLYREIVGIKDLQEGAQQKTKPSDICKDVWPVRKSVFCGTASFEVSPQS